MGIDLVAEVRAGRIGRAHAAERVVGALWDAVHRARGSRAVVLLGPSGVGKTAAVGELVHRLVEREPAADWRVLRLTGGDFLKDTKYLGEWETRVMELITRARRPARVVLHVPDLAHLHTVGRAESSRSNVASVLGPFLESGELCLIGEATPEAFADGLGSVPELRRPFQTLALEPADGETTLAVLRGVADELGAEVPGPTLERVVDLGDLYGSSSTQPGRSVELLRQALEQTRERPLRPRHVLEALSRASGLPTALLDDEQPLDLNAVTDFFQRRVMGQPEALEAVRDTVTLLKAGLNDPRRPLGVMLFVGPTGVGKTELARALAEYLFGGPDRMLRFDLSEFAAYDSFQRLIGVRGGADGLLTSAVRDKPFSVVLFDEIEKAHQNVYDLFLQLFDAGRLTDGAGRTVDFRRTIVILTSNVGSAVRTEPGVGFLGQDGPRAPGAEDVRRELERFFRPEFLNRIDRVVHFRPLDLDTAERIARRELHAVLGRSGIVRRGLQVDVDPALVQLLLERGYSAAFGARPLERTVSQLVLLPLARVLARDPHLGDEVLYLSARNGEVVVRLVRDLDEGTGERELVPVPRRTREVAREEPRSVAEARGGAAEVVERAEALEQAAADLRALKAELVVESSQADFWSDRGAALARLDLLHRAEGLLAEIAGFGERARRLAEQTLRVRRGRDVSAVFERLDDLCARADQLEHLLARDPETGLGDALLVLTSIRDAAEAPNHDGVGRLGRMYAAWARRRGYEVTVLHDRVGGSPFEDAAVLAIDGPGAHALLAGEEGVHQFRGLLGGGVGERRRAKRELVKVEVLPAAPAGAEALPELSVEVRPLRESHGRLDARPRLAVVLADRASRLRLELWFPGAREEVDERLVPLLAARIARVAAGPGSDPTVVRRYDFDPEPRVRDAATRSASPRLGRVLEGAIDPFLLAGR